VQKTLKRKIINTFEMLLDSENTISDIVRSDYRAADVFKKYNINFCCSGQVSLQEACRLQDLDYDTIVSELEEATRNIYISNSLQFDQWRIDFLIDYIINIHHAYLYQAIPALELRLTSFMEGHKKKYPELIQIHQLFLELLNILLTHNRHEEEIIFPYIKQIDIAYRKNEPYGNLFVRTLRKPLSNVTREHSMISELLKKLKSCSNNYTFPINACTNHQVLYHKLREFDDVLGQHKHLEDTILFPKAIEIEQHLLRV
jgi:regulator of cell morphogenesis and NO signaling